MSLKRQVLFWLSAFVILILFIWVFRSVLLPFVAGMAIAYLLDPIADRLESYGFTRLWATITIIIILTFLLLASCLLITPLVIGQLVQLFGELLKYIPGTLKSLFGVTDQELKDFTALLSGQYDGDLMALLNFTELKSFLENNGSMIIGVIGQILNSGVAVVNVIGLMFITPVVTFYLLYDWDLIIRAIDRQLPRDHVVTIRKVASDIDRVLAGFVRGQVLMCITLGAFYATTLTLVGLKFGLIIGLGSGLVSFIPYVGAFIGLVLSVGIALFQFWSEPLWIFVVLGIFLTGQFFEGNILQPNLVGPAVGLHPVSLMFALFAFGTLFGFLGMLVAVPCAAAIGVLIRFALDQYRVSTLFTGSSNALTQNDKRVIE